MYSSRLIDHFNDPRNAGILPHPDGVGRVGDPGCGDYVHLFIRVRAGRIRDIGYEICGCPAAIATTSVLSEMARSRTLHEAVGITEQAVADALGGLPEAKMHCSTLAVEALRRSIVDYLQRHRTKKSSEKGSVRP